MIGNLESLRHIPAAAFLAAYLLVLLVLGCILSPARRTPARFYGAGIVGVLAALALEAWALAGLPDGGLTLFHGGMRADALASLFNLLTLAATLVFLAMSLLSRGTSHRFDGAPEYVLLALAAAVGMTGLAGASDIVVLYLAFELLSFSSYLLTGIVDRDERSTEAAAKYLLFGGTASAVMIYGFSLLYGMTGTIELAGMGRALAAGDPSSLMVSVAFALVLAGLGYKIAAFPFHAWCPDVYEGAATPVAALLSVGSKIAGFAVLIRVLFTVFATGGPESAILPAGFDWSPALALIAAVTMTFGNLAAIPQRNVKRLLAYSSIAHAGYALMGLAVHSAFGLRATWIYLAVYLVTNLGAFFVVTLVAGEYFTDRLEGYKGLAWRGPRGAFLAAMLALCLFSLTGLPPFAGFVGKVYLIRAVLERGGIFGWLAVVAVVNTVISLYYYARVVNLMFFAGRAVADRERPRTPAQYASYALVGALSLGTLALGVFWSPLDKLGGLLPAFLAQEVWR